MQKSKKFIIEDKQGNNMYPATFADVVYTEDGGNVAEKLKQIEGATPNAHTHTKSQITDFAHTHTKSEISDFPTSLPANGGNADTVDGKHASDFVSTSGVQLIDLDGNAKVRFVGSNGTAYIQAGNSTNKGDMVLGGYMGVNLTSFDIMSDDKPTINKNPIYHTGNKPTKADVGLGSVNNWDATSAVNDASTTKYATASAVKQAYDKAVEVSTKAGGLEISKYKQVISVEVADGVAKGTVLASSATGLDILAFRSRTTNSGLNLMIENGGKVYVISGIQTMTDYPNAIRIYKPYEEGSMAMPICFTGNTVVKAYGNYATAGVTIGLK